MLDAEVQLLRAVSALRRDDDGVVGEPGEGAAAARRQREDFDALRARRLGGAEEIRRVAARRMNDQQIAGLREGLYLTREDALETEVVARRGEERRIRRECDRGVWPTVTHVANDVFGR